MASSAKQYNEDKGKKKTNNLIQNGISSKGARRIEPKYIKNKHSTPKHKTQFRSTTRKEKKARLSRRQRSLIQKT
jgi:hypothetical protein